MKGLCVRGSWWPNKDCNILTPTLLAITVFLSRSPGLLNRGPGGAALFWELAPIAWSGTLSSKLWSPTDLNFLSPGLYHCFTSTQFNPTTAKAISWSPDIFDRMHTGAFLILTAWLGRRSIRHKSGPGSYGNEGVLCILQSSRINGTSVLDCLVSYTGHSLVGRYPSAEKQSVYSSAPTDWATFLWGMGHNHLCSLVYTHTHTHTHTHIYSNFGGN